MEFTLENYDQIHQCLHCGQPIKTIKLAMLQKKIEGISEADLKILKLCKSCRIKLPREE